MPAGLVSVTSQLCRFCWWLPRQFSFAQCSALEGLSARQVVTVAWDPQPRASVSEGVAPGGGRAQVTDKEQKGKTVGTAALHGGCSLAVSSSVGLVGLASWTVFSGFRSAGSLGVPGWFCLWALDLVEGDTWLFLPDLVEIRDVGACVVRLWSHVVAPVFRELLCLGGCVPKCCFRIVFDPAGFAGVVFGLTRVVVEAFLCFHCFVVLCGRDSLSQEFVVERSWWRLVRRACTLPEDRDNCQILVEVRWRNQNLGLPKE
ncbi:hypothetical protein Taro_022324 [Colocasia esculenta]|uniref:Uncharacterized protein n=1 Tax=Colocasia esculenta TaxID=4460 RepID=A0A843V825_COLES|nr:hypothetical protein [Colocasia esculenta]